MHELPTELQTSLHSWRGSVHLSRGDDSDQTQLNDSLTRPNDSLNRLRQTFSSLILVCFRLSLTFLIPYANRFPSISRTRKKPWTKKQHLKLTLCCQSILPHLDVVTTQETSFPSHPSQSQTTTIQTQKTSFSPNKMYTLYSEWLRQQQIIQHLAISNLHMASIVNSSKASVEQHTNIASTMSLSSSS
jgi:hypothetical protein